MKKGRMRFVWLPVLMFFVIVVTAEGDLFGNNLIVPGTGACEIILNDIAKAFNKANPGNTVVVPESVGSGGGITAVLNGQTSLARVARPLKDSEFQKGLEQLIFARDIVAFVVGKEVKVKNLTSDQLIAIFSGKIESWKDVGGNAGLIRVIVREPGDSSLNVIEAHMKGFKGMTVSPKAKVIIKDQPTVEPLDKHKYSIGYIAMSTSRWAKGGIRPIAVDSISPTKENALSGKYLMLEDFSFVYNKSSMDQPAKRFIDFVFSHEGRKIIEGGGLIAVEKK